MVLLGNLFLPYSTSSSRHKNTEFFWTFLCIKILCSHFPSVEAKHVTLNICNTRKSQGDSNWGRLETIEIPPHLSSTNSKLTFQVNVQNPKLCKAKRMKTLEVDANFESMNFLPNGYFRNDTEFFHPSEYCIRSSRNQNAFRVSVCPKECTSKRPCTQKCCALGQILVFGVGCIDVPPTSDPSFVFDISYLHRLPHFRADTDKTPITRKELDKIPFHYTRRPSAAIKSECKALNVTPPIPEYVTDNSSLEHKELFRLTLNGVLRLKTMKNDTWHIIQPELYCLEEVQDMGTFVYVCRYEESQTSDMTRHLVLGIFMVISSIFLLTTFLIYAFVLRQKNVHAWTTMSLTGTMFFTYIFLATSHFIQTTSYEDDHGQVSGSCKALGILGHFFFLSMFCWLTSVCFDLWWTFRAITPTNKNSTGFSRFCAHAAFGWGVPLFIIIISVSLDSFYRCESECGVILPNYGQINCYLAMDSLGAYQYYPAAVLLVINWSFFILTFYQLYLYNKNSKVVVQNTQAKRRLLLLCLKLFFVMGISWILEIISWVFSDSHPGWFWYLFDTFNIFQSVGIFLIFTCKKETWDALKARAPERWRREYQNVPVESIATSAKHQDSTKIGMKRIKNNKGRNVDSNDDSSTSCTQTSTAANTDSVLLQ